MSVRPAQAEESTVLFASVGQAGRMCDLKPGPTRREVLAGQREGSPVWSCGR